MALHVLNGQNENFFELVPLWIHENPTVVKVAEIAVLVLGVGLVVACPFVGLPLAAVVSCVLLGALCIAASSVALALLDYFVPPHHDMQNHVYTPQQYGCGEIYYEGDVPILLLETDDPRQAGQAQGYLCGEAISILSKRLRFAYSAVLQRIQADRLAQVREAIPEKYLEEIRGFVEGYQRWAEEHPWQCPDTITENDVLLLHLVPDPYLYPHEAQRTSVACSAFVDRDPQNQMTFARNMDWPSFGVGGIYSLVIHRKNQGVVEVGFPVLLGTLTGMNSHGLSLAMNVSNGTFRDARGMPAVFYNRNCLEECKNVEEVENFKRANHPIGPYHLIFADAQQTKSIHFYQSQIGGHLIRPQENREPLITLNHSTTCGNDLTWNDYRNNVVNGFFSGANSPVEDALALPLVNNWSTTHSVVMHPHNKTMEVAFDNAFAAKAQKQIVPNLFN